MHHKEQRRAFTAQHCHCQHCLKTPFSISSKLLSAPALLLWVGLLSLQGFCPSFIQICLSQHIRLMGSFVNKGSLGRAHCGNLYLLVGWQGIEFLIAVHCDITEWYMTLVMDPNRSIYPFTPERPRFVCAYSWARSVNCDKELVWNVSQTQNQALNL